jgi:hypothetical protein
VIELYLLIRCDVCKTTSDTEDLACTNKIQLRHDLKELGWRFDRPSRLHYKMDLCPDCAKGGKP